MLLRNALILLLLLSIHLSGFAQREIARLEIQGADNLLYAYTLPDSYDPAKAYPVLIAPGMGSEADEVNLYFGPNPSKQRWILIESIALIKGSGVMSALLEELKVKFKVEGFHFLGFSANSAGEFQIAMDLPHAFKSVTAIPGHPRTKKTEELKKLKGLKILMIVGERDSWWKKQAQESKDTMQSLGIDVRLKIVPKGGHILREFAGDPLFNLLNTLR